MKHVANYKTLILLVVLPIIMALDNPLYEKTIKLKGKVKQCIQTIYFPKSDAEKEPGEYISKRVYKYDERGNLLEMEENYANESMQSSETLKTVHEYNDKGMVVHTREYSKEYTDSVNRWFDYNDKGQLIKEKEIQKDTLYWLYFYDNQGMLNYKIFYTNKGQELETVKYICDDKGRIVSESILFGDVIAYNRLWTYDNMGNVTAFRLTLPKKYFQTVDIQYDKKGLPVSFQNIMGDPATDKSSYEFTYKFDKHDNWILKFQYEPAVNGHKRSVHRVITREYIYY